MTRSLKVPDKVILLLSINEFTLKDSFDAVAKIKNIPLHMFDDGYNYVSFDVESLFRNVSIKRTIDIILKRIYIDKVISTNFKKRSMKNLLLDTCTKQPSCLMELYMNRETVYAWDVI